MKRSGDDAQRVLGSTAAGTAGAVAGSVAGGLVGGPPGAAAGFVVGKTVDRALSGALDAIRVRWRGRATYVVQAAAKRAGIEVDALCARMQEDAVREELFIRVLRAAQESALDEKLVALALSLAQGAQGAETDTIREAGFVRVLGDLDAMHLELVRAFTQTSNQLGLGDGSAEFDSTLEALNLSQLQIAFPKLGALVDPALSALEQHGLVRSLTATAAPTWGTLSTTASWRLTPFGVEFMSRMTLVGELLAEGP